MSYERLLLRGGVIAHFALERFVLEMSSEVLLDVLAPRCRVIAIAALKVNLLASIVLVMTERLRSTGMAFLVITLVVIFIIVVNFYRVFTNAASTNGRGAVQRVDMIHQMRSSLTRAASVRFQSEV